MTDDCSSSDGTLDGRVTRGRLTRESVAVPKSRRPSNGNYCAGRSTFEFHCLLGQEASVIILATNLSLKLLNR